MGGSCSAQRKEPKVGLKILMLGGANVGKSTIFKQMRILYLNGFDNEDKEFAKGCIFENILETLVDLDSSSDDYGLQVQESNEELVDDIKPVLLEIRTRSPTDAVKIDTNTWERVSRLWNDPAIQAVFREIKTPTSNQVMKADRLLPDASGYFLSQIDRIRKDDYTPSDDDILHLRRSTTDSNSIHFVMDVMSLIGKSTSLNVECVDVGGQSHERQTWVNHSTDLNAILYVLSLSEFSSVDQNGQNVLQTQLDLLKTIVQTPCFQNATVIVLLNKYDLMEEKLKGLKLADFFDDFSGTNDADSSVEFIKAKVAEIIYPPTTEDEEAEEEQPVRGCPETDANDRNQILKTCATDTRLMRDVIEVIGQSILQKTLSESKYFG